MQNLTYCIFVSVDALSKFPFVNEAYLKVIRNLKDCYIYASFLQNTIFKFCFWQPFMVGTKCRASIILELSFLSRIFLYTKMYYPFNMKNPVLFYLNKNDTKSNTCLFNDLVLKGGCRLSWKVLKVTHLHK